MYNGWSNRATWNVNLWLSNDEGLYHAVNRLERRYVIEPDEEDGAEFESDLDLDDFAEALEAFCKDVWPKGETPDGDLLADADFDEIAASWVEP